jgi:alkylhydroperoxidase family enzyme
MRALQCRRVRERVPLVTAAVALFLLASAAELRAQSHPLPLTESPLHSRVAGADAVVLARVDRVEPGRLQLENRGSLLGRVPERFAVKRWPGASPEPRPGDFAVLFLLGARSPYVLLGETRDQIPPSDEATARGLADAISALVEAGGDRERLLELHLAWLEGEDEVLVRMALLGFLDREGPLQSPPAEFALERARLARDPDAPLPARRASLILASRDPTALPALLAWMPGSGSDADAEITALVLNQAVMLRTPGTEAALVRTLRESDPDLRRIGLTAARRLRHDLSDAARAEIQALATNDPDPELRHLAERAIGTR